jgi:RNA polymerase sigma-70 factor (ECF subfamily)
MEQPSSSTGKHISQIETLWPVLMQAHEGAPSEIVAAQQKILLRYRPAVYRYLLASVHDPSVAEELCSEFSLRFISGGFRNANPEKGRFRDLLKSALSHLVIDHYNRKKRGMAQLSPDAPEPTSGEDSTYESDRQFLDSWRSTLLNKAWESLAIEERRTGRPLHTVLHFRAGHPDLRSHQMAEQLSAQLSKEVSADWVRKWLHAGREKFAELLMHEVGASLRDPTPDSVEEELIDLGLFEYCKDAIADWREEWTGKK